MCEEHDWYFEDDDICPVCQGIELEHSRVLRVIETAYSDKNFANHGSLEWTSDIIKLIKGEQK